MTRFLSQPLGSRDQLPDCHPHRVHLPSSLSLLHKPVPGVSSALDFGRKSQTSGVFVPHIVSLVHLKLPHPRRSPNLPLPLCLVDDTLARTAPTLSRRASLLVFPPVSRSRPGRPLVLAVGTVGRAVSSFLRLLQPLPISQTQSNRQSLSPSSFLFALLSLVCRQPRDPGGQTCLCPEVR